MAATGIRAGGNLRRRRRARAAGPPRQYFRRGPTPGPGTNVLHRRLRHQRHDPGNRPGPRHRAHASTALGSPASWPSLRSALSPRTAPPSCTVLGVGNAGWGGGAVLSGVFNLVGAFPLSATSADAALVITLPPGNYTAQVTGVGNTTGVALVEVYVGSPGDPHCSQRYLRCEQFNTGGLRSFVVQ